MKKYMCVVGVFVFGFLSLTVNVTYASEAKLPTKSPVTVLPVSLQIPSIRLNSTIIPVGVDVHNNMDVPNGKTNLVGWFEHGPVPGKPGTAVLDAHVFAAFKNLQNVHAGDDIFVTTSDGVQLHFHVNRVEAYALSSLSATILFGAKTNDGLSHLNLITCAGKLTSNRSTYDHRLIVFTTLVR